MATANQKHFDKTIRHQVTLRRYEKGLSRRVANLLEEADLDLSLKIQNAVGEARGKGLSPQSDRWKALLVDIRKTRAEALRQAGELVEAEMIELSGMEAALEISNLEDSIPIQYSFATVSATALKAVVTSQPFQGSLLKEWWSGIAEADKAQISRAVQLGMVEGEPIDAIVRRVVGTKAAGFSNGVAGITRRGAQAIVRTAVNHVSNSARNAVWEANKDVIQARIWVSTTDGRTTEICQSRDNKGSPTPGNELPEGILPLKPKDARPPAHIGCRSAMVAYIDGVGLLGNRPTVTDTRTREKREIDFRKMAKAQGKSIQDVRKQWAIENVGRVPADTTYQKFLERQPAKFQDDVLGKTKGQLFRKGGLTVDNFVDASGKTLTIKQLKQKYRGAFEKAGLIEPVKKPAKPTAQAQKIKPQEPGKSIAAADKETPEEFFGTNSETQRWNVASFATAPAEVKVAARRAQSTLAGITTDTEDQAWFSKSDRLIEMGRALKRDSAAARGTWRHELGHAIDSQLNNDNTRFYRSQGIDYQLAMLADAEMLKRGEGRWAAARDKIPSSVSEDAAKAKLAEVGLDWSETKKWLRENTVFFKDIKSAEGVNYDLYRLAVAWDVGAVEAFARIALRPKTLQMYVNGKTGVGGKFSDLIGATTKNELVAHDRGFSGHSNKYYKDRELPDGVSIHSSEAFANITALIGDSSPFSRKLIEKFTPLQWDKYQKIITEE